MNEIKKIKITSESIKEIYLHARKEFPYECCGWILGEKNSTVASKVRKAKNQYSASTHPTKSSRSKIFKRILKEAKIDKVKKYSDGVNTFAKNMYQKTKNIFLISSALGHNSINKTKEIYPYMNELDFIGNYLLILYFNC